MDQIIDQETVGENYRFCPVQAIQNPDDRDGFTVVNNCQGDYQMLFKMRFNKETFQFELDDIVTFPEQLKGLKVCSSSTGYFAASDYMDRRAIYVDAKDGLGFESVPESVLGDKTNTRKFTMECLGRDRVSFARRLSDLTMQTTTILAGAGQQRKYFAEHIEDAVMTSSFDGVAGTIHVYRNADRGLFYRTVLY